MSQGWNESSRRKEKGWAKKLPNYVSIDQVVLREHEKRRDWGGQFNICTADINYDRDRKQGRFYADVTLGYQHFYSKDIKNSKYRFQVPLNGPGRSKAKRKIQRTLGKMYINILSPEIGVSLSAKETKPWATPGSK